MRESDDKVPNDFIHYHIHGETETMSLTIEQAQAQALQAHPEASVGQLQRFARELVSKSQLIDMQNAIADAQANRDAERQAAKEAQSAEMIRQASITNRSLWGISRPEDASNGGGLTGIAGVQPDRIHVDPHSPEGQALTRERDAAQQAWREAAGRK